MKIHQNAVENIDPKKHSIKRSRFFLKNKMKDLTAIAHRVIWVMVFLTTTKNQQVTRHQNTLLII